MDPDEIRRLRQVADQLADFAERLEDGWKVEIAEGQISFVMRSPSLPHGVNVRVLRRQIEAQTPHVFAINGTDAEDPVTGLSKVPDLMAIAEADLDHSQRKADSRRLLLVAEVVSPRNPNNDLREKLEDYPRMGVPVYVVVDPRNGSVTVHSEPKEGPDGLRYRSSIPYAFGEPVPAGQWTFDTADLVRYPSA
ncbi:Uma2 family endonuclease [Kitasatospora sp. RB6PN24]|uniref:Uma2 family endonuclease n=1 Tax=Kitasatospora humi TaxID=2893891 RepID=UPI001E636C39|nr:Uma2 family endonuclease [Kitasatospora humi]MCC9306862.1 Uma2 family endonuclease [Kitasatospora humi]